MFDPQAQARINQCCSDAAMGYMTAANAAYAAMADQALRFWSEALMPGGEIAGAMTRARKSWYVEPERAERTGRGRTGDQGAWACMMPWMASASSGRGGGTFAGAPGAWDLFETWAELMNPKNAMAWPMACGMMAVGIPQSVAWPTARANAATMDAFNTAARSLEDAVVSYRSDGGHAVARVVTAR